jgi:hypothetical protein
MDLPEVPRDREGIPTSLQGMGRAMTDLVILGEILRQFTAMFLPVEIALSIIALIAVFLIDLAASLEAVFGCMDEEGL